MLWRMCAVWGGARPALGLAGALLVATFALNLGNVIVETRAYLGHDSAGVNYNIYDSANFTTYGGNYIGIAAALVSLASNLCATVLVGVKVWFVFHGTIALCQSHSSCTRMHRESSIQLRAACGHRTLAQRVMEILLESGDAHQAWDLTSHNVDCRTSHEPTDRRCWNELNKPTQAKNAYTEDDETADECHSGRNLGTSPLVSVRLLYVFDDLGNRE